MAERIVDEFEMRGFVLDHTVQILEIPDSSTTGTYRSRVLYQDQETLGSGFECGYDDSKIPRSKALGQYKAQLITFLEGVDIVTPERRGR